MAMADSVVGEMNSVLPMMHMEPVLDLVQDPALYKSPLYKTGLRAGVLSTTGMQQLDIKRLLEKKWNCNDVKSPPRLCFQ